MIVQFLGGPWDGKIMQLPDNLKRVAYEEFYQESPPDYTENYPSSPILIPTVRRYYCWHCYESVTGYNVFIPEEEYDD